MSLSFKSLTAKTNNQNDDLVNEENNNNYDDVDYESADYEGDDFDCVDEEEDHGGAILGEDDFDDENDNNLYHKDPEHFEYECYPIEKIDWIQEKKCEKLINSLKLDNSFDAIFLLKQFKWNSQKIIDLFTKDRQHFLETYLSDNNNNKSNMATTTTTTTTNTINVTENQNDEKSTKLDSFINIFGNNSDFFNRNKNSPSKLKETTTTSTNNYCNICFMNKQELKSLNDCLHRFCFDCWRLHFETLIMLGNTSFFECMETKCKSIASKEFVLNCLNHRNNNNNDDSSSNVKNFNYLYRKLVTIDLIKESDDLKLCPGDNKLVAANNNISNKTTNLTNSKSNNEACSFIIWSKSSPPAARRVICSSCQTQSCFLCSLPYHAPNACQTIRKWLLKCQDDSETRNYLLVHTQDCPKCNVCIEKNGGCSHMTCNICKHEFCWICLNDWKTHGASYDCNRYKGNPELDNAREALNRYTHYYHRWINHSNSLKFEKAFKEQCQIRIQEKIMNKGGGTLVDWEFLIEAADLLTRARYTLQYTYPYAYYLESNETKLLFENIQAELERDVENLSHSLEKVNLNDKFNIKTQMNIVETRRKTLLKDFIQ